MRQRTSVPRFIMIMLCNFRNIYFFVLKNKERSSRVSNSTGGNRFTENQWQALHQSDRKLVFSWANWKKGLVVSFMEGKGKRGLLCGAKITLNMQVMKFMNVSFLQPWDLTAWCFSCLSLSATFILKNPLRIPRRLSVAKAVPFMILWPMQKKRCF